MKDASFYQYMKTRLEEKSDVSILANHIINDLGYPKFSQDYDEISDYLEKNPYENVKLDTFDKSFSEYENWLNY
ncbi:sterile alpha motif-like domain-containing protein [Phocicoccus pinnipedialis]|uniref:YozE SAM-like domain-containing protein n=1 Tax=Phocicoccus pinnipedialis TaxID=110845 RepID=A0A6V7RCN9_9BACL|nr:sterile alpha motif-like domain-containing protein [Jeotgalicoccus pinnipedialis]MBP1939406.1 uncharacterized protein YozE (UPF0346 family) [Jeotgalicoccus pinnipedialis]CAD2075501.1 hypothetical protein JEOPIN946_01034 [Jeotgalicoccus pinnipedialis]